jgi:hypothetical protein
MVPVSMNASAAVAGAFLLFAAPPQKPPLDFSGVWVLDEKASRGVSRNMHGAVFRVEQSGDHIRIFPGGSGGKLLGEEIVADGRPYAKVLGPERGVVTAAWSKDGGSLWLEVTAGTPAEPRAAIQRSVWKLSPDRRTWIRQSVSMQGSERREAHLVFRRREKAAVTPSVPQVTPGAVRRRH